MGQSLCRLSPWRQALARQVGSASLSLPSNPKAPLSKIELFAPKLPHAPRLLPNPSLEQDLYRHGTWPVRRSLSSSALRAKHHSGVGPSAQTLSVS